MSRCGVYLPLKNWILLLVVGEGGNCRREVERLLDYGILLLKTDDEVRKLLRRRIKIDGGGGCIQKDALAL